MKQKSTHYIAELLERFMNGATTVEEEQQLGEFFRTTEHIPQEWQDYKTMFAYFDNGMKELPLNEEEDYKQALIPIFIWKRIAVAACIFLLLGATVFILQTRNSPKETARIEQPSPNNENIDAKESLSSQEKAQIMNEKPDNNLAITDEKRTEDYTKTEVSAVEQKVSTAEKRPTDSKDGKLTAENNNKNTEETDIQQHKTQKTSAKNKAEKDAPKTNKRCIEQQIAREYANINWALIEAQLEVQNATMQARGYRIAYDENGSAYYTKSQTETNNIIQL